MRFVVGLLHARGREVRVDLRGAERLMSEEFLHASQIGAIIQEVCGEAVTKCVRADRGIQADGLEVLIELAANGATAESATVFVQEEREFRTSGPCRGTELRICLEQFHVAVDCAEGVRSERNDALFLAFTTNAQGFAGQVEIGDAEPDEFADTNAG